MTECNMLNFLFEIGIVLLLFSLFKRNKGTFFFMKFSILIIAIPVLFVCSFFYLGTEETLQEAMPGIAIWRCAFILLASLLLLGLSTLISHLSFRNLFNKEQKRKILMIESIVYLVLSIGFMATWIYDVFWSISRLVYLCGKSTVFLWFRMWVREQRGDKIGCAHLVRSRGAAAKPRNRALWGRSIVFLLAPICKRACMGANKKTIATVVTTVSRLGGEDKTFDIIPCEIVQHNK